MDDAELRAATGGVTDDRALVGFLYELMRDNLPPGDVETLVRASETVGAENVCTFTNGHLANYARLLADRLTTDRSAEYAAARKQEEEAEQAYWRRVAASYASDPGPPARPGLVRRIRDWWAY